MGPCSASQQVRSLVAVTVDRTDAARSPDPYALNGRKEAEAGPDLATPGWYKGNSGREAFACLPLPRRPPNPNRRRSSLPPRRFSALSAKSEAFRRLTKDSVLPFLTGSAC